MKKKSASRSAFLNLRVLISLCIVLVGVFLALAGLGTFSALTASIAHGQQKNAPIKSIDVPGLPPGFDCATIYEKGIDKQENLRAGLIMIACGEAEGGSPSPADAFSQFVQKLLPAPLAPLAYGAADVDLITGGETSPHVTQSETYTAANPDNPNQIVVTYNDSRTAQATTPAHHTPATAAPPSPVSTQAPSQVDTGRTLATRLLSTTNLPALSLQFFSLRAAADRASAPGSPLTAASPGRLVLAFTPARNDDRESGYADNNPASPFFGRMYVSWNDFARGFNIFVRFSTDNGLTWTNERQLPNAAFRNVQITGDKVTGDVYVAAMNEMGGGLGNRANKIYRSTDGGNTWLNTYTGPTFAGPGRGASGSFACMYNNPPYWRHQGWGQPGAFTQGGNHVVHYVYAARNTSNGDPGDVFYIRSTDSGVTFSAPFQLNTDTDHTKAQWQPNLSVSDTGSLFATWYDETPRVAASCQPSSPGTPCYQMYSRKSIDNGVTWLDPDTLSDVASPLPLQPDGSVQTVYAGDYDYGSAIATKHVTSWVDGRVAINNASQQNAFTDREPLGTPTPTPTASPSVTPTATATATATATPTVTATPQRQLQQHRQRLQPPHRRPPQPQRRQPPQLQQPTRNANGNCNGYCYSNGNRNRHGDLRLLPRPDLRLRRGQHRHQGHVRLRRLDRKAC